MKTKVFLAYAALLVTMYACQNQQSTNTPTTNTGIDSVQQQAQLVFKPLPITADTPADNPLNADKIALGRALYYESRISKTGHNSCNSCHNIATYGVDNAPTSKGDNGTLGGRNSPTTLHAALHTSQFWDGRAARVEEQAGMPVLNPVEMAMPSEQSVVAILKKIPNYVSYFEDAFPGEKDAVTYSNFRKAIAAFERTLITPSPFDAYLSGDANALNDAEKAGLKLFMQTGCASCHNGVAIGGGMFQKFGLANDYHALTGSTMEDIGRKKITSQESDKDVFKVPSLRNIAKTYPYFHDGSVRELDKAVQIMAKAQLNKDLNEDEVKSIVLFLETLTGTVSAEALHIPAFVVQAKK